MKNDQIRYQDALPKVPASFIRRMSDEIGRMDDQMVRRHKTATVLVAVMILAALITGAAFAAARSDLLWNLFPSGAPPEAEQLLVTDNLTDERDGLKLTLKEHLYDGRNFHLTWAVESTREDTVYVTTEYRMLDKAGEPIEISQWSNRMSSMDQSGDILKVLNAPVDGVLTPNAYEGYTSNGFLAAEAPTEPWTYTLDIYAYSSALDLVALNVGDSDILTDGQMLSMEKNGQFGIEMKEALVYLYRYPAYQAAKDESDWSWSGRSKARVAANEKCGLLTPLTHLSVTLPMDPAAVSVVAPRELKAPVEIPLEDGSVRIDELGFDLTGIRATYVAPESSDADGCPRLSHLFLILDQDGRMLNETLTDGSCSWLPQEGADGEPMVIVEQGGGVPEAIPSAVRLIRGPAELQALLQGYDYIGAFELWQANGSGWEVVQLELE